MTRCFTCCLWAMIVMLITSLRAVQLTRRSVESSLLMSMNKVADKSNPIPSLLLQSLQSFSSCSRNLILSSLVCCSLFGPIPSHAVVSSDIEGMTRFESSLVELMTLDRDWEKVLTSGGPQSPEGDNIRRKLGTVYSPPKCESSLCSFPIFVNKFARAHTDDLDVSAFEEPINKFLEALNQADFLAYSSVFSDYGNGGGGKDYLNDSHNQVKRAIVELKEVIKVLKE
eukprot:gene6018-8288_t